MNKYKIIKNIEEFAPPETQEDWDCSGWSVNVEGYDEVNKIMICLTVTEDIVNQAIIQNCDMIISHHPMFYIDFNSKLVSKSFKPTINIYCAHTNFDKAEGGSTDTIISKLGLEQYKIPINHEFLRMINHTISIENFSKLIKQISPHARLINNYGISKLEKIAFCAGSGSEFIQDAKKLDADCLVTGDLKFHTALDSSIVVYDIGHFESEIIALPVFENLIKNSVDVVYAKEKSPFKMI